MRHRSATVPDKSVTSSTLVQKQVGQTMVQLPHVRHRSATTSQCGLSRFSRRSSATPGTISRDDCFGDFKIRVRSTATVDASQQVPAKFRSDFHEKLVATRVRNLGQ